MARGKKQTADPESEADFIRGLAEGDDDVSGFVFGLEDNNIMAPKYFYSTGLPPLDIIIGEGGFASGKITEIFGPERTGKSELVQTICESFLNTQRGNKGIVVYFDQELAIDDKKLEACPVFNDERMIILVARSAEKLFKHIIKTVTAIDNRKSGTPVLVVVDSVAALETEEQADNEVGKKFVSPLARVMSSALPKIRPVLQRTNAHLLFVNQIRDNIGAPAFVEPESPGGRALKFFADYRIRTQFMGNYYFKGSANGEAKGYPDGLKIKLKTIKNKRVPPLRDMEIPLIFERGPWGKSGFNPAWAVYYVLHKAKKITATGGVNYITGKKDAGTFSKEEWGSVFSDPSNPIYLAAMQALSEYGETVMSSTSLGAFDDDDVPGLGDDFFPEAPSSE